MDEQQFTLADLLRVLKQAAGEEGSLDGDDLDIEFTDLGYDSLALMETASVIELERGVALDESEVAAAITPRSFLKLINRQDAAAGGA